MKRLLIIINTLVLGFYANAQEVVASGGGTAVGEDVTISYTIGETVTETFTNDDYILSQGFQQGIVINKVEIVNVPSIEVNVFPNPTANEVFIESSEYKNNPFKLVSINGSIINSGTLNEKTALDLSNIAKGSYILTVEDEDALIQFEIIKN